MAHNDEINFQRWKTENGITNDDIYAYWFRTGPQGPQGLYGPQGLIGVTGTNGSTGADGPQGPVGASGASTSTYEYVATVTTFTGGMSAPVPSRDTLGHTGVWARTGVGTYTFTLSTMPNTPQNYSIMPSSKNGGLSTYCIVEPTGINNNVIEVRCYDASDTLVDTNFLYFRMEIFPS